MKQPDIMTDSSSLKTARASGTATPLGGVSGVLVEERPALLRFLTRRLGNEAEAEDVLQDVWVKLDTKPIAQPVSDPLAYLFRMCENAARDLRRSEMRLHAREAQYAAPETGASIEPEAEAGPEQALLNRHALQAVEAQLRELPERTRHIFLAFRLDGISQKQLAHDLGISISAVQKHLQRAYRVVVRQEAEDNISPIDAGKGRP